MTSNLTPYGSEVSVMGSRGRASCQAPKGGNALMHLKISQEAYVVKAGGEIEVGTRDDSEQSVRIGIRKTS